jgi:hypothetical protein
MVSRGQLELFGAGDCEPVLAAIPERDRISQLEAMNARLERHFGLRPAGAWLTERVWESSVVPSLVRSGVRYVLVDDYHFLCAGVPADALDRHFATEEDGLRLDVFPISEALRYRLPFAPAADALGHLESLAAQGHAAAIHFDDLEKFGIWPETHEWVYGSGWLAAFVEAVLASPTVRAESFSAFHAGRPARGLVYLPTTSYIEMNEWTRPRRRPGAWRCSSASARPAASRRARPSCVAASGATSSAAIPRATGCTSGCCGPPPGSMRRVRPPRSCVRCFTRRSPTTPTGTDCSAGSTCRTCGARPGAACARSRQGWSGCRRARRSSASISTWTAATSG